MAQVIWTEPALENLEEIAEYIALSNPGAAASLVQSVFEAVERLERFPDSGRIPQEVGEFDYRELIVNPCRVFYKAHEQAVYIVHVLRQERDVRRYILSSKDATRS